jgi:hypothetical protein
MSSKRLPELHLSSSFRGSSRSPTLNTIGTEILLDETEQAELYNARTVTTHILGITTIQPDVLSRLSAPTPSPITSTYNDQHDPQIRRTLEDMDIVNSPLAGNNFPTTTSR